MADLRLQQGEGGAAGSWVPFLQPPPTRASAEVTAPARPQRPRSVLRPALLRSLRSRRGTGATGTSSWVWWAWLRIPASS